MDIYEHRRKKLRELISTKFDGRDVSLAKLCEAKDPKINTTRISQFLSLKYRDGKSLTEKAARALEAAAGLRSMFFDEGYSGIKEQPIPDNYINADELSKLFDLYARSTSKGRDHIFNAANDAEKITVSRRRPAGNQE